ncbi:hypothetical protein IV203_026689 [Nitzschia inconspicua]|uniref:Uncharacterized protein n=1 Tax=Nitzschia inconspicua TaxID=303405 RepID=A0A9K3Q076_9STRA|nr:hypothetical protein IV203_026689 [Nitzschia inconspicua]
MALATRLFLCASFISLLPIDDVLVVAFSWSMRDSVIPLSSVSSGAPPHATRISKRRSLHHLFSSKRPSNEYYYDDDYRNDDDDDTVRDTLKYPSPRQRGNDQSSKMKRVTKVRRSMRVEKAGDSDEDDLYDQEENDDFLEEDDFEEDTFTEDREDRRYTSRRRFSGRERMEYGEEEDLDDPEYYYDDEEEEDFDYDMDAASGGNFWSNPKGGLDRPPPGFVKRDLGRPRLVDVPRRRRPQREYDGRPDYYVNDSKRSPRRGPAWRSPVRVGSPPPNPFIEQLYDKIFFYGFDMDEDDQGVGDKSVFGGTKGKFNGLKYLALSQGKDTSSYGKERRPGPSRARAAGGLPPARSGPAEEDYYEDDYEEDDLPLEGSYPPQSVRNRYNRRVERGRRSSGREMDRSGSTFGRGGDDWVSKQVSSWFTDDEDGAYGNDDDEYDEFEKDSRDMRLQGRRRHGGRERSNWSPMGMLDSFLRIDRDQMAFKAAEYDSKMGIRRPRSRRKKGNPERPDQQESPRDINGRRPGYAYRYDASLDDDDSPPVLDIELTEEVEEDQETAQQRSIESGSKEKSETKSKISEKSWEERQAAVERVPPVDVPAWGPKGQLSMNARQKAIEDALKDIQTAKRKLNQRVKREIRARDEIAILNVDAKALRLKMDQSRSRRTSQLDVEELRAIELEIDDASRALRRARKQVDLAKEELQELEDRHYAVLSYYNPDQAAKLVGDALNEFSGQVVSSSSIPEDVNNSGVGSDS